MSEPGKDIIVARDLLIGAETGKSWHIAHLSTRGALESLLHARAHGGRATAEVTPHHLLLTDEAVKIGGEVKHAHALLHQFEDVLVHWHTHAHNRVREALPQRLEALPGPAIQHEHARLPR